MPSFSRLPREWKTDLCNWITHKCEFVNNTIEHCLKLHSTLVKSPLYFTVFWVSILACEIWSSAVKNWPCMTGYRQRRGRYVSFMESSWLYPDYTFFHRIQLYIVWKISFDVMLDYENIWNIFLSLTILKPNQFFELGYSAEMCRDLLRVLLSQSPTGLLPPRSSVTQQRAALGRHPHPPILSTPQYTPTLAPHHPWQCTMGTNLKAYALYRAGKIRLLCAKLFLQCWKKTEDISLLLHSHINEKRSMRDSGLSGICIDVVITVEF